MSQYTSYYLYQKYVSYDNGSTWVPVYPEEYSISGDSSDPQTITKKQDNDPECGYTPPVVLQYRWVQDGDNYICDECGYVPPTPQYRTISGAPYCTGYDKMVDTQYQVSYDSGSTWSTVSSSTLTVEHNSEDCGYTPPTPTDYSTQYLTFRALEDCSFSVKKNYYLGTMSYSLDSGDTWVELANTGGTTPTIQSGDTVMWKGVTSATTSTMGARFKSSSGSYEVEGNIMSLKYGDNFIGQTTLPDEYSFCYLFSGDTGITSAENLVLPATATTRECYMSMFRNCTNLTTAPSTLPSTSLFNYCYQYMFAGCTSLTAAPTLPATDLGYRCYDYMFSYCTSLTTPPELPATTLSQGCYRHMFEYCTSLTTAPVLSAATLAQECYYRMFINCVSLGAIACLATDTRATDCTYQWLYCVSSSGTFIKAASMSNWTTGNSGIPSGWTVQDYQG